MTYTDLKTGLKKTQEENKAWEQHAKEQVKGVLSKEEAWEKAEKEVLQFKYAECRQWHFFDLSVVSIVLKLITFT